MNQLSATFFALSLLGSSTVMADLPAVNDAWVREAPPTSIVNAAYMHIVNPGAQDIIITGASSPQFEKVEIHLTVIVDGMAQMKGQKRLRIPASGHVALAPNGLHLMLIKPTQPIKAGEHVNIALEIEGGGTLQVDAEVRPAMTEDMDHSQHMRH